MLIREICTGSLGLGVNSDLVAARDAEKRVFCKDAIPAVCPLGKRGAEGQVSARGVRISCGLAL